MIPCLSEHKMILTIRRFDFICIFNMSLMRGTLDIADNRYSFDSFLRILYSSLLIRKQGCLMHAAGIIRDNMAIVFPGVSGSGKTTISRACKRYGVISDEIVAIRQRGKTFVVHSTPFWGEMKSTGKNKAAPLKIIYFLCKSGTFSITEMERPEKMVQLARCLFMFEKEPLATTRAMTLLARLTSSAHVKTLGFPRNRTIPWPFLIQQKQ